MPSNYTIAKKLQRISYYLQICGKDAHVYAETAMQVQGMAGLRLEDLVKTDDLRLRQMFPEGDESYFQTLREIVEDSEITVLKEDTVPLTVLDITEIKGLGPKMVRRMYDELGITDLTTLKAAVDNGALGKTKGFGPKLIEKINAHLATLEKKRKK